MINILIGIVIFAIILAIPVTIIINIIEKKTGKGILNKIEPEEKPIEYTKQKEINYEELKDIDIDKLKIEELKKIYIQLITVETKLDKLNRILENIDKNVGLITFIIVLPIIIGILLLSQGMEMGNTIINSIQ